MIENNDLRVYTLEEVQELLKVTRPTIYSYIKTGKLKATKIGRYWRVKHDDLKEFIDHGTNA